MIRSQRQSTQKFESSFKYAADFDGLLTATVYLFQQHILFIFTGVVELS